MEPISSVLIPAITESVFGALAEAVGLSDWLRQRLGRDPEKVAFQQALTQALTDSATHYPGRDLRYFAEILRDIGGPLLARTLQPAAPLPTADELTNVWLNHLTVDSLIHYQTEFTQFATHFLERLQFHLENQQPLRWITQARHERDSEETLRRVANAAEQSTITLDILRQELASLTNTLATVLQTNSGSTVATGGGAYVSGNVRAQYFAGRDLTINQYFVEGLARLVFNYSARIENFLYEYLGSKEKRVPFGGRQAQIDQLNTWLDTPDTPPYLLMVAEAGGGKSALVTRWCAQLATRTDLDVIFVPISIRFQTAAQDVAFAALAARLAQIYEQQSTLPAALSAEQWKGQCETYLRLPLPAGKRLLVVIDGLDEATGWEAGPELFAKRPPAGLRILVTARVRAKETDADRWATRLGWQDEQIASKLHLPGLDRRGIEEALVSMGNPLDYLAAQVDLVGELYRLSQGDPLVVRLYVEALQAMGAAVARLLPDDLANIEPGLDGFMERWWEDQRKQWRMQGKDPFAEEERLLPLLHACTVACGPLLLNDLAELDKQHFGKGLLVTHMAELLGRWVIGDGRKQGYVFSHPRLRNYFGDRMTPDEEREWQAKFCGWGERTLTALNVGTIDPKQTPEYLLRYYATHLEQSHAPAEAFYALISNGWRLAWEWVDISYGGFLNDVDWAWLKARQSYDPTKSGRSLALIHQIKAALCRVSVGNLGNNLPPELLKLAIQTDLYTPMQALAIVKVATDGYQQARFLEELAPCLPKHLLKEALSIAQVIKNESYRSLALRKLAKYLSNEDHKSVLSAALAAALTIKDDVHRVEELSFLARDLDEKQRNVAMREVLAIAQSTSEWYVWNDVWSWGAPLFSTELIEIAFVIACMEENESACAKALERLAPYLSSAQLNEALTIVRLMDNKADRAKVLASLAPRLSAQKRKLAMNEALTIVGLITDKWTQSEILKKLGPHLSPTQLYKAIKMISMIEDERAHARHLESLASYLPPDLLNRALTNACKIKDEMALANALGSLAPHLSTEYLRKALMAAYNLNNETARAEALGSLAPHLPPELLSKALTSVCNLSNETARAEALEDLAPHLPMELLNKALTSACMIKDELARAKVLKNLAPHLPTDLLEKAVVAVRSIETEQTRARPFIEIVRNLSESNAFISEAVKLAKTLEDKKERAEALLNLASHQPGSLQTMLSIEAITAASMVENSIARRRLLVQICQSLPTVEARSVIEEAIIAANIIGDKPRYVAALCALASSLPSSLVTELIILIQSIEGNKEYLIAVQTLIPHLSSELTARLFATATLNMQSYLFMHRWEILAPYLPEKLLEEWINKAIKIWKDDSLAHFLISLSPYLPERLLTKVLALLRTIKSPFIDPKRTWESEMIGVLVLAKILKFDKFDVGLSTLFFSDLPNGQLTSIMSEMSQKLLSLNISQDSELLETISLSKVDTATVVNEIWQAVHDKIYEEYLAEFWIDFGPYLPKDLLAEVIIETWRRSVYDDEMFEDFLISISSYTPTSDLLQILTLIKNTQHKKWLDPIISDCLILNYDSHHIDLVNAFTDVLKYNDDSIIICILAARLMDSSFRVPLSSYTIFCRTLEGATQCSRPAFIKYLQTCIPDVLLLAGDEAPQAAEGIYQAIQEVCGWWP